MDDRVDVYACEHERWRRVALESTVALIAGDSLVRGDDGTSRASAETLGEQAHLCANERFVSQPAAAACSGVLMTPTLVLTAGHCVTSVSCADARWVFNYALGGRVEVPLLHDDDIYRCRSVLLTAHGVDSNGRRWDHAFVELDRAVAPPRQAVTLAPRALTVNEPLVVIGYPAGLPAKIDRGALVLDARPLARDYFSLTSDTSEASSGSGVFDETGALVGIVVRGQADYEYRSDEGCSVSRHVSLDVVPEEAEQASYAVSAMEALCDSGAHGDDLCWKVPVSGPEAGCALRAPRRGSRWPVPSLWMVLGLSLGARCSLRRRQGRARPEPVAA